MVRSVAARAAIFSRWTAFSSGAGRRWTRFGVTTLEVCGIARRIFLTPDST
jgi:hypothetical protein